MDPVADRAQASGDISDETAQPGTRDWLEQCLRADFWMNGVDSWKSRYRITRGELYFLWLLRRSEYWCDSQRSGLLALLMRAQLKIRSRRLAERLGFEVPRFTFGPGLSIAHSGLLVVHPQTRVGARCRIHQGVTLGAAGGGSPTIGDDVFIGPNALVIGGVNIGNGAFVFPGAVCTRDVPAGHSAVGVPAQIRPGAPPPWRPEH